MNLSKHLKTFIIDEISGEKICGCGCGRVVEEKMPTQRIQEDYHNDSKNKNLRVGLPSTSLLHDGGLSTIIGKTNVDVKGSEISISNKQIFYRIRAVDEWSRILSDDTSKRRMVRGLPEVTRICEMMCLNKNVIEQTAVFYRKAVVAGLSKGKKVNVFVAACCYLVCKQLNIPITLHDFADKLQCKSAWLLDCVYLMTVENEIAPKTSSSSSLFITQIANKLSIKNNVILLAIKIIELASSRGITDGKNPKSVCCAALYLACNEIYGKASSINLHKNRLSMDDISDAADISHGAVCNTIRAIKEYVIQGGLIKP